MKPGDLVEECIPLMAGDVPGRIGIILEEPQGEDVRWYKVLFDKPVMMHYNSLKKLET
tara:strand:+ start:292 stop:465 length:174 start_codon:yes stop_codon:yes gene_type:complete